jgi:nucleotide-binding universal stress UspA family protein
MTVLVAFAPTPHGDAAFTAGLAEARRRGEDLLVVNSPRAGAPVSVDVATPDRVERLRREAADAGVRVEVRQEAHTGVLAEHVIRTASHADVSLIVIGLRRRSPVGKLFMGSDAQRILLEADRPVLAVKP